MDRAIGAPFLLCVLVVIIVLPAIGRIRDIGLRNGRQVDDRIRKRVRAAEGDNNSLCERWVGERNISTGVSK